VEATELCGSERAAESAAATTVVASSIPTIASIGRVAAKSMAWRAALSGLKKSRER
jgi:hypothetical protein